MQRGNGNVQVPEPTRKQWTEGEAETSLIGALRRGGGERGASGHDVIALLPPHTSPADDRPQRDVEEHRGAERVQ